RARDAHPLACGDLAQAALPVQPLRGAATAEALPQLFAVELGEQLEKARFGRAEVRGERHHLAAQRLGTLRGIAAACALSGLCRVAAVLVGTGIAASPGLPVRLARAAFSDPIGIRRKLFVKLICAHRTHHAHTEIIPSYSVCIASLMSTPFSSR